MKSKKMLSSFLIGSYVFAMTALPQSAEAAVLPITAQSAILMEVGSQRILYSKNQQMKRAPASTVKLLTSLVVLDHLNLMDVVTIPGFVSRIEPSKIYLKPGERYYVRDLVRATLLNSANDAAETLGVAVAGSTSRFGDLMNQKARSLGCRSSNFVRPSGLPANNQYSTAYDMALIMNEAQRNPFIVETLKLKTSTMFSLGGRRIGLRSHNKMLWKDSRQVLGKTGWTRAAKHCFVGTVISSGKRVLVSMFGSKKLWKDLKKLVDYQFGMSVSKSKVNDRLWSAVETRKIQLYLKRAGFSPGAIDGQFGPRTVKAIEMFQSANGLPPDGVVGVSTYQRLRKFA